MGVRKLAKITENKGWMEFIRRRPLLGNQICQLLKKFKLKINKNYKKLKDDSNSFFWG